jgi:hypothetical protein
VVSINEASIHHPGELPSILGCAVEGGSRYGLALHSRRRSERHLLFANLAPIFRGRTVENVTPFKPVWGALTRDEIFFGDGTVTFALGGQSPKTLLDSPAYVWRMLGQALNCAYYEKDDDEILASFGANTLLFEHVGALNDGM